MYTILLAKLLGLVFIVLSLTILFHRDLVKAIISDLIKHPSLQFIAGVVPLILGSFIVVVHNNWVGNWSLLVTLVGWLIFLGGVFRLLFVSIWVGMLKKYADSSFLPAGLIVFVVSLLLLYVGFFAG